ncbi:hypothetical protein [Mesorhizobium sp. ANAO-SY3R2]|uniref:hypothetical protein n=1 Tax=Mesorhizobium sp. ANAO-SY3R2 TaxID=3166644 RepID=UPI00366D4112
MKSIGQLPTPYGVSVPVYFDRDRSPVEDDCYFHDIDGCMTLAGVHGTENRGRCAAEIRANMGRGGIDFGIFLKHGGRKALYLLLENPVAPVYPRLPHDMDIDIPIENWVTLAMDCSRWDKRADVMLEIIASNLDHSATWDLPLELHALALSQMLTASLEHLVETEIDCLEAAAMYALTLHYSEWSKVGVEWLASLRSTWFADWRDTRPSYKRFAKLMRVINPDLPGWIAG